MKFMVSFYKDYKKTISIIKIVFYAVFVFLLLRIKTTMMTIISIIAAQIPAVGKSSGLLNAFVHMAIFLMNIAIAYPAVALPSKARTALNHLGKTSANNTAVMRQINAINIQITKCIEKPPLYTTNKIT